MKLISFPENIEEATRYLFSALRKNPPSGFHNEEARDRLAQLSDYRIDKIIKVVKLFPKTLEAFDLDGCSLFHWAARYQSEKLLKKMVAQGANFYLTRPASSQAPCFHRASFHYPISEACMFSKGPSLEYTFSLSSDLNQIIDSEDCTALHIACFHSNKYAVQLLMQNNVQAIVHNHDGNTPLHLLCLFQKKPERIVPCLELLLQKYSLTDLLAPVNKLNETPLDVAKKYESHLYGVLMSLIEKEALLKDSHLLSFDSNQQVKHRKNSI